MIYDIAGIGIGPFNLGLAALLAPLEALTSIFFDRNGSFSWHPGMMIPGTTLQVPFYADLVTLADPASKFNFFCFLKSKNRMIRFSIYDNNYITRKLFNEYCNWVVSQLGNLHFGSRVCSVHYNQLQQCYEMLIDNGNEHTIVYARHIVCGTGSEPFVPGFAREFMGDPVFHSASYLYQKGKMEHKKKITLIGSGQSAAEIFYDFLVNLAESKQQEICWVTRSPRFFPMDFSKLSLEMTSPDYIRYFYHLPGNKKKQVLQEQDALYKGINASLIGHIYEKLYELSDEMEKVPVRMLPNMELQHISREGEKYLLDFFHAEQEKTHQHTTDAVILATGYQPSSCPFFEPVKDRIQWQPNGKFDVNDNYSIDKNRNEIFVQNAELHTHGFNAPDLGMGPHRNAIIINSILGYEYYVTEKNIAFQEFGV